MSVPSTSKPRPSLPSSSSAFALPSVLPPSGGLTVDIAVSPFMMLRSSHRTSALGRVTSPLTSSLSNGDESDRERMSLDGETPPSGGSQDHTPPPVPSLGPPADVDAPRVRQRRRRTQTRSRSPSTPPRGDSGDFGPKPFKRPSHPSYPIKHPGFLRLLQESRPEESEVKSEAQFQRLLSSTTGQPNSYFSVKAPSDRGRYPEEADTEEPQRDDSGSDGEAEEPFTFSVPESSMISKPSTPVASVNGDETPMIIPESPGMPNMDIDMLGSPVASNASVSQWRYTPPPTASVVRTRKRKLTDADRHEPYPYNKRRALSPSLAHMREHHRTPSSSRDRLALAIPSGSGSAMSSPTVSHTFPYPPLLRGGPGNLSSPTLRSTMILQSPILRPLSVRSVRREEEDEREISGAGSAVSGLTLC